nr:mucin-5AC-like [Procambarus clarkii]
MSPGTRLRWLLVLEAVVGYWCYLWLLPHRHATLSHHPYQANATQATVTLGSIQYLLKPPPPTPEDLKFAVIASNYSQRRAAPHPPASSVAVETTRSTPSSTDSVHPSSSTTTTTIYNITNVNVTIVNNKSSVSNHLATNINPTTKNGPISINDVVDSVNTSTSARAVTTNTPFITTNSTVTSVSTSARAVTTNTPTITTNSTVTSASTSARAVTTNTPTITTNSTVTSVSTSARAVTTNTPFITTNSTVTSASTSARAVTTNTPFITTNSTVTSASTSARAVTTNTPFITTNSTVTSASTSARAVTTNTPFITTNSTVTSASTSARVSTSTNASTINNKLLVQDLVRLATRPSYKCTKLLKQGGRSCHRIPDGDKKMCLDASVAPSRSSCIVYSVGIGHDFSFDKSMGEYGCEVFSFDDDDYHTIYPNNILRRVHFIHIRVGDKVLYQFVLDKVKNSTFQYLYRPLDNIMYILRHDSANLELIKMDVEGDEWNIFKNSIFKVLL